MPIPSWGCGLGTCFRIVDLALFLWVLLLSGLLGAALLPQMPSLSWSYFRCFALLLAWSERGLVDLF